MIATSDVDNNMNYTNSQLSCTVMQIIAMLLGM